MCTSVRWISSEVFFNLLKLHLHQETKISLNLTRHDLSSFAASYCHFESLFCVRCVLCTSCCVRVTLTNTKANPGFFLYDQLNKARSHSHQSQINKTHVAYHFCFYLSLQKHAAFPTNQSKPVFAKNTPIKKTNYKNFKPNRIYYEPTSLGS